MPSAKNNEILLKSRDILKEGKGFYFTDFTGLTVHTLEGLRRELKKHKGEYLVIKNTLGSIAFRDLGLDETMLKSVFVGSTGIAIAYDDPVVLAKILKETANLKIKGGYIEGSFYDTQAVTRLSRIPPKQMLIAQLLESRNIVGNLVGTLQGTIRNLIYTLDAVSTNMKGKEAK
jgi:large subunit ribosomal protein L10